jgi:hypothetical protein
MGGSDQFFGLVPFSFSNLVLKGIRGFGEHAGVGGNFAAAVATGTAPNCFRLADRVTSPCFFAVLRNVTSCELGEKLHEFGVNLLRMRPR